MGEYEYVIDKVVKTPKTNEIVRKMIPIMIGWAVNGENERTYGDMNRKLGYSHFTGIANALGRVDDVIRELSKASGKTIPSLNSLCKNAQTKLPADGFAYVYPSYKGMSFDEKRIFVDGIDKKLNTYKHWDWVLDALGLEPASDFTDEEIDSLSHATYGHGGEGEGHKALKEYVKNHPELLGIKDVATAETEHVLPSGDRLDVYFILKDGTRIAVEVKPSTSPEQDVSRGIFQCVKYEATMIAERRLRKQGYQIKAHLVLGAEMTPFCRKIANELNVSHTVVKMK